jgi:acetyl esterase/lipase
VRVATFLFLMIASSVAAHAQLLTWPDLLKRPHPQATTTIEYGTNALQKVDLWRPEGKDEVPVVVMIHGGCWQTSIADRHIMDWIADDLRKAHIAVWNIEYRGVDRPGGGYPGTFNDVAKATDQLATVATKYHLDTRRVVAVGHSAGGHLALWLAGRPKLPKTSPLFAANPLPISHVISLGGLPDLDATAHSPDNGCGCDVVVKLVGAGRADPYADTSVPPLFPLGVGQDLVNGREDDIIPGRMATDYVAKATAAGDQVTLHLIPNTGHVELIAPESAAWAETKQLIKKALGK